jgi:hypothetical protein
MRDLCYNPRMKPRSTRETLRTVEWCNLWNYSAAYHSDGVGTKTHLTTAEGLAGKTLCGRRFPTDKGYPSNVGFCKACLKKAYAAGHPRGFTKALACVPSEEADPGG